MTEASRAPAPRADPVETIVVGAGIAGLAYAHARGPAADLLVLESGERAGGLVRTGRAPAPGPAVAGELRFEWGPEALQDNAPETNALIDELGLQSVPASASASRRWVLLDGRLREVPADPGAMLTSGLLSPAGKLRALTEPLREAGLAMDGSVADFVRHRLGQQVLERLVDPFVSGIYAGDPELLSLRAAFPLLHELVSQHGSLIAGLRARSAAARAADRPRGVPSLLTVRGGLGALPDAIAATLGARLRLACRVTSVAPGEHGGWQVEAQQRDGVGERACVLQARRLVIAAPAAATARLLAPTLPPAAEALASMHSESVVSISHAWRRQDVRHALDGFGYLVPSGEQRQHLGTLFSSSIAPDCCPPDLVLLRTLCGGARQPRMVDWPDEELLALVRDDVAPIVGLPDGAPVFSAIVRNRHALPRYDLQHPARQVLIEALLAEHPDLALLGSHRRGISCNALIETARRLAREHAAS